MPLRERNSLLLAVGYAPMYAEGAWDSEEMQSITRVLKRMLHQNEPYPAVVMDRYWNVFMANEAAPKFFNRFFDMSARQGPRNMLVENLDQARVDVSGHDAVDRKRTETAGFAGHVGDGTAPLSVSR